MGCFGSVLVHDFFGGMERGQDGVLTGAALAAEWFDGTAAGPTVWGCSVRSNRLVIIVMYSGLSSISSISVDYSSARF